MAEPLYWKSKLLLIKAEAVYGVDAAPGADDAMLVTDIEYKPMEGTDEKRNLERPWMGADEAYPAGLSSVLTFSVELAGSGRPGVPPAWSPIARACGLAEIITEGKSVEYRPVSRGHEAVTGYFWIDIIRHRLTGARATAELRIEAQKFPHLKVTLTGLWQQPDKVAPPPNIRYDRFQVPDLGSSANTPVYRINGVPMTARSIDLKLGCDIQGRFLMGAGQDAILLVDREEEIQATVTALPPDLFDPIALAMGRTKVPVEIVHGTAPGLITELRAPNCQMKRLSGYQNQQKIVEWPLALTPQPVAGNDQFSIILR